ncbi:hypothetical protein PAXRUDRAFT_161225, partial [Paxillus rubicundulus Ve08.2h10]
GVVHQNENALFGEAVNNYKDGGETRGCGELFDEVYRWYKSLHMLWCHRRHSTLSVCTRGHAGLSTCLVIHRDALL